MDRLSDALRVGHLRNWPRRFHEPALARWTTYCGLPCAALSHTHDQDIATREGASLRFETRVPAWGTWYEAGVDESYFRSDCRSGCCGKASGCGRRGCRHHVKT